MPSFASNPSRTLADVVLQPRAAARSWLADGIVVVLFSAFVALSARIAIPLPWTEVPLTGQTLAVLLTVSLGSADVRTGRGMNGRDRMANRGDSYAALRTSVSSSQARTTRGGCWGRGSSPGTPRS